MGITSTADANALNNPRLRRRPSLFPQGVTMPDSGQRNDQEANKVIKRIETQLEMEGKLNKAIAAEGAGYLFLPVVLAAVGLVGWALKSLDIDGPEMIFLGVPILLGLGALGYWLSHRR